MMKPLVTVKNLKKHFPLRRGIFSPAAGTIKAVDGVSFSIMRGETFGLVGESGCGKSTTARTMLKLLEPTGGDVLYEGESIFAMDKKRLRRLRREIQFIFQDPYSSLNPRLTVGEAVGEAVSEHGIARGREKRRRVEDILETCGLSSRHYLSYPHEFSGGQRQRIGIARALVLKPRFVIADEPVSALDVSIQSQIINLLKKLQNDFRLTYLFISHDLSVVRHICDRVGVMYLGSLVEEGPKKSLYHHPLHPYTRALLSAIPAADPTRKRKRIILTGDVPSPANPPRGCLFHPRCVYARPLCRDEKPSMREMEPGHYGACHML